MQQTRRSFLTIMGAAAAAGLAGPRLARAATSITVLNWQGYGTDEAWAVKAFTEKTGIQVVHDYFSSEPEMLTKLRTNPGVYDVVLINSARVSQAVADSLVVAADFSKVPNTAGLSPDLVNSANRNIDGTGYGVPWVWGMTAMAAREGGTIPDSYAALGDPANVGRVALSDDAVTMVALVALLTGQDMNKPTDLAAITDKLKSFKPNVKLMWSSEDQWNKSFAAKEFDLSVYWSGSSARSKRISKLPVQFVVPKEGALVWMDTLNVVSGSANPDAALAFINYMIDPEFYVEWATKVGAPASANTTAMDKLPADDLTRLIHDPKYLKTSTIQAALTDEQREAFNNLWQEVKAFYAA